LIKDLSRDELLARLDAKLGEPVEEPDSSGAPACLGLPQHGWTIIADSPLRLIDDDALLSGLSRGTTVLIGFMEEHVMYSHAELFVDGRRVWKVISDREKTDNAGLHLAVDGTVPAGFAALVADARLRERQTAGVDFQFEVPFQVVSEATGGVVDGRYPWGDLDDESAYRTLVFTDSA
jgi:hypothetical protein